MLSLPSPAAVDDAMAGILETARVGTVVVDTSTVDPETNRRWHAAARARGVGYLDAPLSGGEPMEGGTDGARAASVTFMVGGEAADLARAEPVMRLLGSHVFHLGPSGTGSEVKLISNMCSGAYVLVVAEAFAAGTALGISPERLVEVFRHTDAKCYYVTDYLLPRLLAERFDDGFAVRLQLKDHRLFATWPSGSASPTPVNDLARATYEAAMAGTRTGRSDRRRPGGHCCGGWVELVRRDLGRHVLRQCVTPAAEICVMNPERLTQSRPP